MTIEEEERQAVLCLLTDAVKSILMLKQTDNRKRARQLISMAIEFIEADEAKEDKG